MVWGRPGPSRPFDQLIPLCSDLNQKMNLIYFIEASKICQVLIFWPGSDLGMARLPGRRCSPFRWVAVYRSGMSTDGRRLAKMFAFHGKTAATVTDILHSRQLALAHMGMADFRRSTEGAILAIATGIAEVSGVFGHRPTLFTGIGHRAPPCQDNGLSFSRMQLAAVPTHYR